MNLKKTLQQLNIDINNIMDENIKSTLFQIFNIIEDLSKENQQLREENQKLRDENNFLKGEQGKPNIKPKNNDDEKEQSNNFSSEEERKNKNTSKTKYKKAKKANLKIDKHITCKVDKSKLPKDAIFKGFEFKISQDIQITSFNTEFKREKYYSPSTNKIYLGAIPDGYEGDFGPGIKALTIMLCNLCNVSQPKISDFYQSFNIDISKASISNMLIHNNESFYNEKDDIYETGLKSTKYQQIDDTGARINGCNHYTTILCNPYFTAYFTRKNKNRLTVLEILQNKDKLNFIFNTKTMQILKKMNISKKICETIYNLQSKKIYNQIEVNSLLKKSFTKLGPNNRKRILEAGAITYYHHQEDCPIIDILIADDAPQFKQITEKIGLCWIHDGRHYKKDLRPIVPYYVDLLNDFRDKYWKFYKKLLDYKLKPSEKLRDKLLSEFDTLFSTKTKYKELNKRIEKTKSKKNELLLALEYPNIPLHNNASELGVRAQVRKRDVSLQTRTDEGTKSQDAFLTIIQTAKKLKINVYNYLHEIIIKKTNRISLANLITVKIMLS